MMEGGVKITWHRERDMWGVEAARQIGPYKFKWMLTIDDPQPSLMECHRAEQEVIKAVTQAINLELQRMRHQ